jgi:hypothetical protein
MVLSNQPPWRLQSTSLTLLTEPSFLVLLVFQQDVLELLTVSFCRPDGTQCDIDLADERWGAGDNDVLRVEYTCLWYVMCLE